MNNRQRGYYRDKAIVEAVEQYRCLNTEQIQCLLFKGMKAGQRKCQMRLKKLTDQGRLKRWRYSLEEPYAYYRNLNSKVEQMEHTILLNWALIWLQQGLKSWEELHSFTYEVKYPMIRPDAFAAVKNSVASSYRLIFVEMDRAESGNRFDKVRKYNELYESDAYAGEWWVKQTKRFPRVLIVTTDAKQAKRINDCIKHENRNGLEFVVQLVNSLRKELTA